MHMTIGEFIIIMSLFMVIMIATSIILFTIFERKNKRDINELKKYELDTNLKVSDTINSIPEILDIFINNCFADYVLINLPPDQQGMPQFVTDDMEIKIRKDLAELVSARISNTLLQQISIYYNLDTIGEIIGTKIYAVVMNYAIQSRLPRDNPFPRPLQLDI